jgi:hypothetical protein
VPGQALPGDLRADPGRVASPHAVKQVAEAVRRADVDVTVPVEPNRHGGGVLGPGGYRLGDVAERWDRPAAELGGVPGMYGGLVLRLPGWFRPGRRELSGGPFAVVPAEVGRVEEDTSTSRTDNGSNPAPYRSPQTRSRTVPAPIQASGNPESRTTASARISHRLSRTRSRNSPSRTRPPYELVADAVAVQMCSV